MNAQAPADRRDELLIAELVDGLTASEAAELAGDADAAAERAAIEAAAAAVLLAARLPAEPLPEALRARLLADARRPRAVAAPPAAVEARAVPAAAPRRGPPGWVAWGGWLAAAASLLVAVFAGLPRGVEPAPAPVASVAPPPAPADLRAELVARAGVLRLDWSATPDPAARGAVGDVVWDNATQTGYMRFAGLAANDPAREQYQLWVFDGTRDERYPVDGGVFDVPPGTGEVVVPIRATLRVGKPMLFAVTVEKPGGVMVSSRERIVLLAQVAAS